MWWDKAAARDHTMRQQHERTQNAYNEAVLLVIMMCRIVTLLKMGWLCGNTFALAFKDSHDAMVSIRSMAWGPLHRRRAELGKEPRRADHTHH